MIAILACEAGFCGFESRLSPQCVIRSTDRTEAF